MTDEASISNDANIAEAIDITLGGKKNVILDATILSTLMGCPRLADFRFNLNLQSIGGKSNSLEVGSVIHKFLEVYYDSITKSISKKDAAGFAYTAAQLYIQGCPICSNYTGEGKPPCGHKIDEYPGVPNTPAEDEGYKVGWKRALSTCEEYLEHYRNDHWVPLEVETVKGEVVYEDDEVRVLWKAKLDLLSDTNQGIYPVDHKTMKQRRDDRQTKTLNNQFLGQCLVTKTRSMYKNNIGLQKTLKADEKFTREMISFSANRLLEWQSTILPYYAKLLIMYAESGYFPPNWTHCETKYGNCAFAEVCSADEGMREEELKIHFKVGPEWNPTNDED